MLKLLCIRKCYVAIKHRSPPKSPQIQWRSTLCFLIHLQLMTVQYQQHSMMEGIHTFWMKTEKQHINKLQDNNCECCVPNCLMYDHANNILSNQILEILCVSCIGRWTSEPYQENQTFIERCYQTAKLLFNPIMDRSVGSLTCWQLCLQHVFLVLYATGHYTYFYPWCYCFGGVGTNPSSTDLMIVSQMALLKSWITSLWWHQCWEPHDVQDTLWWYL